jgi:hypothetical protein
MATLEKKRLKSRPLLALKKISNADAKKSALPQQTRKHAYNQSSGFSTQRAIMKEQS